MQPGHVADTRSVTLREVASIICREHRVDEVPDSRRACNGLQLAMPHALDAPCKKVAIATDASLSVIESAADLGADLLIVHHGLTWTLGALPLPCAHPEGARVKTALQYGVAVLGLHLPMDAHPTLGNNARIAAGLGADRVEPWYPATGVIQSDCDWWGLVPNLVLPTPAEAWPAIDAEAGTLDIGLLAHFDDAAPAVKIADRLAALVDGEQTAFERVRLLPEAREGAGPLDEQSISSIAICSGAAGGALYEAAEAGANMLLSGEAPAHASILAAETGISLLLGGHHATETLGPKALTDWLNHLSRHQNWALEAHFISAPIGL